jgi:hypothetical protein
VSFVPGRTYHRRYGYSWPAAVVAEFWWRLEHLPYRGSDGGLCGFVTRYAYGKRKAAERRLSWSASPRAEERE